ncbi:MAG: hypothetical protein PVH00_06040, partial [Gemmatimonadota bacterium]
IVATLQPGSASPDVAGQKGDLSAARFPLVRLVYPINRLVLNVGYGSFLEQSWGIRGQQVEGVGADSVEATDIVESTGGLSRLVLGAAYPLSERLAVGVETGLHAGVLDRRVRRTFPDSVTGFRNFDTTYRWGYRGPFVALGVRWDPADALRLSGAVTFSGRVDIEARSTDSNDDAYEPPLRLAAGGSARISSLWMATFGAEWSGRGNAAEPVFTATDAIAMRRDAWHVGGGFEYLGLRSSSRSYPFRVGGSWRQLPFYDAGETPATEWSGSLGMGFRLAGTENNPLAMADLAFERGRRSGLDSTSLPDGLRESYWRMSITLSLFGN